ncbi:MAG TPA: radical SAM protein [Blastocatellia bacterium]|nr:radical SAM protein [Blastocatellia bacterium]
MRITEIFYSIQGESSRAGLPCVFVRTTGCDLRCNWCDTEYSFYGGVEMTLDQIIAQVDSYGCKLVELTGGEPLLQREIYDLADRLLARGYTVMIETGGHRDISQLDPRVIKIMDIKCPGSNESEKNLWSNLDHLQPQDEVKFVLADMRDYEWARDVIRECGLEGKVGILLSVVHGALEMREVVERMLADHLKARFQLQLHKYVWSPEMHGV